MSSPGQIEAIEAEFNYYKDSVALLRARLYRWGVGSTPRLKDLQRRRDSAERRLTAARIDVHPTDRRG